MTNLNSPSSSSNVMMLYNNHGGKGGVNVMGTDSTHAYSEVG
jgi:hypothetical protein